MIFLSFWPTSIASYIDKLSFLRIVLTLVLIAFTSFTFPGVSFIVAKSYILSEVVSRDEGKSKFARLLIRSLNFVTLLANLVDFDGQFKAITPSAFNGKYPHFSYLLAILAKVKASFIAFCITSKKLILVILYLSY